MTNAEILKLVGRNVRQARTNAKMTQECLAELVGVHWQTLSYIERGKNPCSITTFARLSQYLKVSPNRLLEGLEPADEKRLDRLMKALARKRRAPQQT